MKKNLYILIGVPASGKSTFREAFCVDKNITCVSTDDIVLERAKGRTYDEAFQSEIKAATKEAERRFKAAIDQGSNIMLDRTNLTVKSRRPWIEQAKAAGYDVWGIVFTPPATPEQKREWDRRLRNRPGKTIPRHILNNMLESFTLPDYNEGWFKVIHRNSW